MQVKLFFRQLEVNDWNFRQMSESNIEVNF